MTTYQRVSPSRGFQWRAVSRAFLRSNEERPVKYRAYASLETPVYRGVSRPESDVLPAPGRVHCEKCKRAALALARGRF